MADLDPDAEPAAARTPARAPAPSFLVTVVCSGNICRSPIAEQVLRNALAQAGLAEQVRVSSAGTGDWHVGQGADATAARVLRRHGYPGDHVARQITDDDLADADLVLAADRGHERILLGMLGERSGDGTSDSTRDAGNKVRLLRTFDPDADSDEVPDPWSGPESEFEAVLEMTEAAAPGVVAEVLRRLTARRLSA
jgi:protein-tyrosine phosphatase